MGTNYLDHRYGNDNLWEGYSFKKVYRDENDVPFPDGNCRYAAYSYGKLLGYTDTQKKTEELFLKNKGRT